MKTSHAAYFWNWFRDNEYKYDKLPLKEEQLRSYLKCELNMQVKMYEKFLEGKFVMMPNGDTKLIITANGRRQSVAAAENLVASAPTLAGWTITALTDRTSADYELEELFPAINIDIHDVRIRVGSHIEERKPFVALYVNGGERIPDAKLNKLARKILLNVVGERVFAERVSRVIGMPMVKSHIKYMKGLEEVERWIDIEWIGDM